MSCRFRSCQTWSSSGVLAATCLVIVWETQWQEIFSWTLFRIYILLITADSSDRTYKMFIVINHLNKGFQEAMSDAERQSMMNTWGRMSCRQYMKSKPIKWSFKGWCRCFSQTGFCMSLIFILAKGKNRAGA